MKECQAERKREKESKRDSNTKWGSGLAQGGGYGWESGGRGGQGWGVGVHGTTSTAFCSAPMEEQLLISGWNWGRPGTKPPFDQEPHRSAGEILRSVV